MPIVVLRMKADPQPEARIVEEFTRALVTTHGVDPELIPVMRDEHERENIGKAAGPR